MAAIAAAPHHAEWRDESQALLNIEAYGRDKGIRASVFLLEAGQDRSGFGLGGH
jgi:hypothetical protein